MATTRLSSKGQVVIPKALRERHKWASGTLFEIEESEKGLNLKPVSLFPPSKLFDVKGMLKFNGPAKTLEEMDESIAAYLKDKFK